MFATVVSQAANLPKLDGAIEAASDEGLAVRRESDGPEASVVATQRNRFVREIGQVPKLQNQSGMQQSMEL